MRKIYFISCCIFLAAVCTTVIQSCKKNDDSSTEAPSQGKLLDNAKAWFKAQALLPSSPDSNDIQLSLYKPDWNKFKVIKNAGGTDVIGIPLSTNDGSYMEINYFNLNERNFGIIKKYNWANQEMMIYSGTGRLQQKGIYDPQNNRISVLEKVNGTNTMKLAFEDMYYLPEVTVYGGGPPPPPPNPPYTFPPGPLYIPYDPNTNPNNTYYGGSSGGSTTTTTSAVASNLDVSGISSTCPKFKALVSDLPNLLKKYPRITKSLAFYTGFTEAKVLELMQPGKGPKVVTIPNLKDEYGVKRLLGQFDGANVRILIDENWARGFEIAKSDATIQATGLLLAISTLHEFVHYGRYENKLTDLVGTDEAGWTFEGNINPSGTNDGITPKNAGITWINFYPYNFDYNQ